MNTTNDFSEQEFDRELRKLIKTHENQQLSSQFTEGIMNRITEEKSALGYKPVISKWVMILITTFFGFLMILTQFQSGSSEVSLWSWPEYWSIPITDIFSNWQFTLQSFSMQSLFSSGLFLSILGLMLALGIHYVFMVVLTNQSNKKVRQLFVY